MIEWGGDMPAAPGTLISISGYHSGRGRYRLLLSAFTLKDGLHLR